MASLTKHPKSQFWTACYTARDGRQLKRSTKTTDRRKALQIAVELERVEMQSREGAMTTTQLRKILSDCVRLQWENVQPEQGLISYQQKKTGRKVLVPMHYHVIEHLKYLSQFSTEGYFCPNLVQRVTGGRNGLSGAFTRIVVKAGLDPGVVDGKGIRKFTKLTFHSLRHSFTSALANAGISEEVRMKLTGHSSKPVHHGYTHLELETLKSAVTALPLFTPREPEPA